MFEELTAQLAAMLETEEVATVAESALEIMDSMDSASKQNFLATLIAQIYAAGSMENEEVDA